MFLGVQSAHKHYDEPVVDGELLPQPSRISVREENVVSHQREDPDFHRVRERASVVVAPLRVDEQEGGVPSRETRESNPPGPVLAHVRVV